MEITALGSSGLMLITPKRNADQRGYFAETHRADRFREACGDWTFVQENESRSSKAGTLRGLHFQAEPCAQGKLVRCTAGALFDVAVDIRQGSPSYGQWAGKKLSAENGLQLWIPPGFAHGFCTLEPGTVIIYKVTNYYCFKHEHGLAWNDLDLSIEWPDIADPETLSQKDTAQPSLQELPDYFSWRK